MFKEIYTLHEHQVYLPSVPWIENKKNVDLKLSFHQNLCSPCKSIICNFHTVLTCPLYKIPLNFGILTKLLFQSVEFYNTLDLLFKKSLTKHMSKLAHGIKILQISKLNFSLHVDVAEFSSSMDLFSWVMDVGHVFPFDHEQIYSTNLKIYFLIVYTFNTW